MRRFEHWSGAAGRDDAEPEKKPGTGKSIRDAMKKAKKTSRPKAAKKKPGRPSARMRSGLVY
jgi:hypothetical protein